MKIGRTSVASRGEGEASAYSPTADDADIRTLRPGSVEATLKFEAEALGGFGVVVAK
jgi:hypothetical protein